MFIHTFCLYMGGVEGVKFCSVCLDYQRYGQSREGLVDHCIAWVSEKTPQVIWLLLSS